MRSLGLSLLLLFGVSLSAAWSASKPATRVWIYGREYVRVEDWARAEGLAYSWVVRNKALQLSNPDSKILVMADSRKIVVNTINVWLAEPVAARNGSLWMAPVDLNTTLQPLLKPSRLARGRRVQTVCIDPGHGGKDPGNRSGSRQEKVYTLLLARELGSQLEKAGFKVQYTRSNDSFVDLDDRPEAANRRRADLFLSLHFNAAGGKTPVKGIEVFCMTPARTSSTNARGEGAGTRSYPGNVNNSRNILLAYHLQKSLLGRLKTDDRGVRRARFAVLRSANMPAALIEGGFMSSPTEARLIFSSDYRTRMASAIVEAVRAYKKSVES